MSENANGQNRGHEQAELVPSPTPAPARTTSTSQNYGNDDIVTTGAGSNLTPKDSAVVISIKGLPPRPTPQIATKKRQAVSGCLLVLSVLFALVGTTHAIALTKMGFPRDTAAWWIVLGLIYSQAGMVVLCLWGVLCVNPGIVPRTQQTCFPIPTEILPWIIASSNRTAHQQEENEHRPTEQYLASADEGCQETYCTRCLVWRRRTSEIRYFHCNVCQQCVAFYDHHCDIFGRCIAGTSCRGNLIHFYGLLCLACTLYVTCLGSILAALLHKFNARWVVPLFVACLLLLHYCFPWYRGFFSKARGFCLDLVLP